MKEYEQMIKQIVTGVIEKKAKKVLEDDKKNKLQKNLTSKFKEKFTPSLRVPTENEKDISKAGKKISDRVLTVINGRQLLNDEDVLANFDFKTERVSKKEKEPVGTSVKFSKKSKERDIKMEIKGKYSVEKETSKLAVSWLSFFSNLDRF